MRKKSVPKPKIGKSPEAGDIKRRTSEKLRPEAPRKKKGGY